MVTEIVGQQITFLSFEDISRITKTQTSVKIMSNLYNGKNAASLRYRLNVYKHNIKMSKNNVDFHICFVGKIN